MKDKLVEAGWTDPYCDRQGANCSDTPAIRHPALHSTVAISHRLAPKAELKAIAAVGDLGRADAYCKDLLLSADWSSASMGVAILFKPIPRVRVGGGPLVALLTGPAGVQGTRSVLRPGLLVEGSIRSSEHTPLFLYCWASYRLVARRWEGLGPGGRGHRSR